MGFGTASESNEKWCSRVLQVAGNSKEKQVLQTDDIIFSVSLCVIVILDHTIPLCHHDEYYYIQQIQP